MQSESSNGTAEETIKYALTSNDPSLTEQVHIEETPFTAVRVDTKWFLALGRYRLSDLLDTFQEVEDIATKADWNLLTNMMYAIAMDAIEGYNQEHKPDNGKALGNALRAQVVLGE